MSKSEPFNYQRLEWIPPAWAAAQGTEDLVIAYSNLPRESVYIIQRQGPPITVEVGARYDYYESPYGFGRMTRKLKEGVEPRLGQRRRPLEWYREIRTADGNQVRSKNRLVVEEAYVEWLDADNKIPFEMAFPGHPELLKLSRDNPLRRNVLKNETVAGLFAHGQKGHSGHVDSDGDRLWSYGTVIMQRMPNGQVIYNATNYSNTTIQHQGVARSAVLPNYFVYEVPIGARDLLRYLMESPARVIATSKVGPEIIDLVQVPSPYGSEYSSYYREFHTADVVTSESISDYHAYLDYRDADRRLFPVEDAFREPERRAKLINRLGYVSANAYNPRRYKTIYGWHQVLTDEEVEQHRKAWKNPLLGKRHWFYPFDKWHHEGTRLLAQSEVKDEVVSLYGTRNKKYFLEIVILDNTRMPRWGYKRYVTPQRAEIEYRDADRQMAPKEVAFE